VCTRKRIYSTAIKRDLVAVFGHVLYFYYIILFFSFCFFSHIFLFFFLTLCPRAQAKNKYCDCMRVNGITDGFSAAKVKRSGVRMRSGGKTRLDRRRFGRARLFSVFVPLSFDRNNISHARQRVDRVHNIPTHVYRLLGSSHIHLCIKIIILLLLLYIIPFLFCGSLFVGGGAYLVQ